MIRQLCIVIGAFCIGILVANGNHDRVPAEVPETNTSLSVLDDRQSHSNNTEIIEADEPALPRPEQVSESQAPSVQETPLLALEQENAFLRAQIKKLQMQAHQARPTGNIAAKLQSIFEYQERDELWASEVEIQAADFLYISELQEVVKMKQVACKTHVCQLSFQAFELEDGNKHWLHVHNALIKMPWMRQFKTITAVQNGPSMQVHLSLKRSTELRSEY
ncbi:hypothetical protein [Pseudoalteromonas luteoviolacea]|uniref:Uncharacterized protein n=1 Tax=Pseudoalteromonas luteoviolacea NCIMB 1942 TaxID=1365253 RepID=A0A167BB63_9GAMM|nr:hypothetical protein [Pseudoalteromonas luteoviolacea]KZN46332.1 hypothetical protein N482_12565 [Pseudoalteromonas luteoviolacea NCIMB 1942]